MIIAYKGERVTCENGHGICTVAKDIDSKDLVSASQFEDWLFEVDTRSGSRIPVCPVCSAPFLAHRPGTFPDAAKLCINRKWRP
jgi:hypothetical protein